MRCELLDFYIEKLNSALLFPAQQTKLIGCDSIALLLANKRYEKMHSSELKKGIDDESSLSGKVEFFFKHYDWLSDDQDDFKNFSFLFVNTGQYNPYLFNYLALKDFYNHGNFTVNFARNLFRNANYPQLLQNYKKLLVTNEGKFYFELALQGAKSAECKRAQYGRVNEELFTKLSQNRCQSLGNTNESTFEAKKTNKTRVAVLFTGQLRGGEYSVPVWFENLGAKYDCEFFISTWEETPGISLRQNDLHRSFSKKIADYLYTENFDENQLYSLFGFFSKTKRIDSCSIECFSRFKVVDIESETFFGELCNTLFDDFDPKYLNQLKMYYKIHRLFNFVAKEKQQFDIVIRLRSDLKYTSIDNTDLENALTRPNTFSVLLNQPFGVDDKFSISSMSVLKHVADIWSSMVSKRSINLFDLKIPKFGEELLLMHLFSRVVDVFKLEKTKFPGMSNTQLDDMTLNSFLNKNRPNSLSNKLLRLLEN